MNWEAPRLLGTRSPCCFIQHVRLIYCRGSRALPVRKSGVFAVKPCYLQHQPGLALLPGHLCSGASQKGQIRAPGDSHPAQRAPFREKRWVLGWWGGRGPPSLPLPGSCPAPDGASGSFINAKIKPRQATPSKARPRTWRSL